MYRDQRRRELRQVLGALAACGAMVGLAGGCGADQPKERLVGSQSFKVGEAAAAVCPRVADQLTELPSQAISGVARNLGLIEIQVAAANQRLAARNGAADLAAAQSAVLGTLENQRVVLIRGITTILGSAGEKPDDLDSLATCTLEGGAEAAQPVDTAVPSDTAAPADSAAPSESAAPTGSAAPGDSAAPLDTTAPRSFIAPSGTAEPSTAAKPAKTPKPSKSATPTKTAKAKGEVEIFDTKKPTAAAKAAPSGTAAPKDTAAPAATGTADPAATDTAAPADTGDGGTPAPTGADAAAALAVVCPPVAEALVDVPRVIKSEVARNIGLLELQIASVNRQLVTSAEDEDATATQEALLSALQEKRGVVIDRIATRVYRATGTPPSLDDFATCTLNADEAAPTGTAAPTDTAAPSDSAAPTDSAAPVDTAEPSESAAPTESAAGDTSSGSGY